MVLLLFFHCILIATLSIRVESKLGSLRNRQARTIGENTGYNVTSTVSNLRAFATNTSYINTPTNLYPEKVKRRRRRTSSLGEIIVNSIGTGDSTDTMGRCGNILQAPYLIKDVSMGINDVVRVGGCKFAERFEGLRQFDSRGDIGLADTLSGRATNPLRLKVNHNERENIAVGRYCMERFSKDCGISLMGRGPTGVVGTGAISVMFRSDKSMVGLSFGAVGASKAVLMFFRRDGHRIEKVRVDITETKEYRFTHRERIIAGVSVYPKGEALKWHKFKLNGLCHD